MTPDLANEVADQESLDEADDAEQRPSVALGLAAVLESDPFRFVRSNADLARMVRQKRAITARPYSQLVSALLGTAEALDEETAHQLWKSMVGHRNGLRRTLGRPVPLRAAAIDWLYSLDELKRPVRPLIVSRAALAQLIDEGQRDALTGLPRRLHFERGLARESRRSQPSGGGCLVFIDLDGFKGANDRLGHAAGDSALRSFARVAQAALRTGDLIGRIGGDEFALMLRGVLPAAARRISRRLRRCFERACSHERVSFSFGIAELRPREPAADTMARADTAMYRQKRRRKRA